MTAVTRRLVELGRSVGTRTRHQTQGPACRAITAAPESDDTQDEGEVQKRLTIVAPGGWTNPSARVRGLAWASRFPDLATHTEAYIDTSDVRATTLFRHAIDIPRAETRLRHLAVAPTMESLLVQREASPLSMGRIEERLLRGAGRGVYDIDDALYLRRSVLSPRRLLRSHRKAERAASSADVVIAGSNAVADWARQVNRRVVQIPSCVDLADYDEKVSYEVDDHPTLLWIGSATTEAHLHALAPALRSLRKRIEFRVAVIGAAHAVTPPSLAKFVDRRVWSNDAVRNGMREADVGIMPLIDEPFERGKCAYKLLQYAAAGLPVVGSPVGASAEFLARAGAPAPPTIDAWTDVLYELLTASAAQRHQLGSDARMAVRRHYTYDVWHEEWRDAVFRP